MKVLRGVIGAVGVFLFFYVLFDVYTTKSNWLPVWANAVTITIAVLLMMYAKKGMMHCCCHEKEEKPKGRR